MHLGRTTLSQFLIQQLKGSDQQAALADLLVDIAAAVKAISSMTAKGALAGVLGSLESQNVQGETQKKLDLLSDKAFINTYDEIEECYRMFDELGVEEYMWDWEGKFVDEAVVDKLYRNYIHYFKG